MNSTLVSVCLVRSYSQGVISLAERQQTQVNIEPISLQSPNIHLPEPLKLSNKIQGVNLWAFKELLGEFGQRQAMCFPLLPAYMLS